MSLLGLWSPLYKHLTCKFYCNIFSRYCVQGAFRHKVWAVCKNFNLHLFHFWWKICDDIQEIPTPSQRHSCAPRCWKTQDKDSTAHSQLPRSPSFHALSFHPRHLSLLCVREPLIDTLQLWCRRWRAPCHCCRSGRRGWRGCGDSIVAASTTALDSSRRLEGAWMVISSTLCQGPPGLQVKEYGWGGGPGRRQHLVSSAGGLGIWGLWNLPRLLSSTSA